MILNCVKHCYSNYDYCHLLLWWYTFSIKQGTYNIGNDSPPYFLLCNFTYLFIYCILLYHLESHSSTVNCSQQFALFDCTQVTMATVASSVTYVTTTTHAWTVIASQVDTTCSSVRVIGGGLGQSVIIIILVCSHLVPSKL